MRKNALAVAAATFTTMVFLAGCSGENGSEASAEEKKTARGAEYVWTLATHNADDSVQNQAFRQYIEEVSEKSGGRIQINLTTGGSLGSQREIIEGVNLGTIEMGMGEAGIYVNYIPEFGVLNLPFLYDSEEEFFSVMDGEVGQKYEKMLEESTNLKIQSWLYGGMRDVYATKEMNSLEDLKGMKIRTPESSIYVETFKALGANPTAVAATEMYTALQQGIVEGMEGSSETGYTYKIYEVAENCLETGHVYADISLIINKNVYNSLPDDLKQVLDECGENLEKNERQMFIEAAEGYKEHMIENGVVYKPIDREAAKESVKGFYDTFIGDSETMRELYGDILNTVN